MNDPRERTLCAAVVLSAVLFFGVSTAPLPCQQVEGSTRPSLEELKAIGAKRSTYRDPRRVAERVEAPAPRIAEFRRAIRPILEKSCFECHGPDEQEADVRLDTMDPDLMRGKDVEHWLDVLSVLTNGEMPPDDEAELTDEDRKKVIEWLSTEVQVASRVRRDEKGHSSFRRMTRYEYRYALQDLLGLPLDFARDLPPEATSEDGFRNSSELLHMSTMQLTTYRESARKALLLATVRGERAPAPLHWAVTMKDAAAREWAKQDDALKKLRKKLAKQPKKLAKQLAQRRKRFRNVGNAARYIDRATGRAARVAWAYNGARYAWKSSTERREVPPPSEHVAILPAGRHLIVELGDRVPETGTLRVRARASRTDTESPRKPALQLEFGWQASNDSRAWVRISDHEPVVEAAPDAPSFYEWRVPLSEIYPRNSVRGVAKMGQTPSPSEYVKIVNAAVTRSDVQLDYVEVSAPVYESWPPESHTRIFFASPNESNEPVYAREILERFMSRAWRRAVQPREVNQKLALFRKIRPTCADFQEAMVEVLASVLASPSFLYLVRSAPKKAGERERLTDVELATRLSMFLWCSTPDDELRRLAERGRLRDAKVLRGQVDRMLRDPRARRFSRHFVRQWLGLQLLDYYKPDKKLHPRFPVALKDAMQEEPIAFFRELLRHDRSVLDFLHADFTMANERLARHYGLKDVHGNEFRRVSLGSQPRRGGVLTQAGLLAMNSDGKDSHPLKRGIWMLESLLNDPPPPPPPDVPEIDLADPEIAKLTLKQRIEDHRNQKACMSCHERIDPWGIAFENYDAVGKWRDAIAGKPVDATSVLFNKQRLDGMDGLKRFLLEFRQDQFARALVHKMSTFALGRPLAFGDRTAIDRITGDVRRQGDGLATMVRSIACSDLFQSR